MARAERTLDRLAPRIGDDRAWEIAGVNLADERSVRASREVRRARAELEAALRRAPLQERLRVFGRILCADLPRPVNDR